MRTCLVWRAVLFLFIALTYTFLYMPIIILIIFSFNTRSFPAPFEAFTLKWYIELFHTKELWISLINSLIVATLSSTLSIFMTLAMLFVRELGFDNNIKLFYGSLLIPETMLATCLMWYFTMLDITMGIPTLVIAHIIPGLGAAIPILYSKYNRIDKKLKEASEALGATKLQTFYKITLPLLQSTTITTGFLIFMLSFDDFILSYFCAGTSVQTLSLYLLSIMRSGISPIVNSLSTILFALSTTAAIAIFLKWKNSNNLKLKQDV